MYEAGVERLQEMIDESSNIVFFRRSRGYLPKSNIPDFSERGWNFIISLIKYSPEEVVKPTVFL